MSTHFLILPSKRESLVAWVRTSLDETQNVIERGRDRETLTIRNSRTRREPTRIGCQGNRRIQTTSYCYKVKYVSRYIKVYPHRSKTKIFTARKRSLGQGNIFASVCHLFTGTKYLTPPVTRYTPNQVHPPRAGTPPGPGAPPRSRYIPRTRITPPWDQVPPRTRYTTQTRYTPQTSYTPRPATPAQNQLHPPGAEHAGRYGQHAGSTHPTGMQSCLSSFRGATDTPVLNFW